MEENIVQLGWVFAFPLVAFLVASIIRNANLRDASIILIAVGMFAYVVNILLAFNSGSLSEFILWDMLGGIQIAFSVEPLGMIFALVLSFLWGVTSLYSIGYMRGNKEKSQGRFSAFFALSIFAALGIAFAKNMFTLFIFYELLTLCTYPLVTHHGNDEAKRGGRVYLGILIFTSVVLLLPAIIITYNVSGTLDFAEGGILADKITPIMTGILLALYMFGIGKAALMPIHRWLPAAMVAPTPVSALLHAVAVVKAGVFTILKVIIYIFGYDNLYKLIQQEFWSAGWLIYISGFTIIAASVIALNQDNLKRRLAYSTVSQLSYVIMAAAILVPKSIVAAAFHIAAHAFGKITLFFAAGAIYTASKKKKVSQLSGIGKRMPITMTAFAIASFSMIGIPPTVGFLSKWYMLGGALEQEQFFVLIVIAASTILNAGYFLPIVYKAFFENEKQSSGVANYKNHGEAPIAILIAISITAFAVLALFFVPGYFLDLAGDLAK
ncbi:proton-conducting transporter membrane subunit [Rickettsiales bacterium]|nr:proton-conducting transporter membrane subunit [Rickettsiales bacterium]